MSAAPVLSRQWLQRLPFGVTAARIAADARGAGLAFLEGSASHWAKRELADWLRGPYAMAARYAGAQPHVFLRGGDRLTVSLGDVASITRDARWHVLSELEAAALPGANAGFAERMLAHGLVMPARADDGIAWLPVDAHARLRTRVLALFAADALARPLDYSRALYVCHRCESVVFDPFARRRGECGRHHLGTARASGIAT